MTRGTAKTTTSREAYRKDPTTSRGIDHQSVLHSGSTRGTAKTTTSREAYHKDPTHRRTTILEGGCCWAPKTGTREPDPGFVSSLGKTSSRATCLKQVSCQALPRYGHSFQLEVQLEVQVLWSRSRLAGIHVLYRRLHVRPASVDPVANHDPNQWFASLGARVVQLHLSCLVPASTDSTVESVDAGTRHDRYAEQVGRICERHMVSHFKFTHRSAACT